MKSCAPLFPNDIFASHPSYLFFTECSNSRCLICSAVMARGCWTMFSVQHALAITALRSIGDGRCQMFVEFIVKSVLYNVRIMIIWLWPFFHSICILSVIFLRALASRGRHCVYPHFSCCSVYLESVLSEPESWYCICFYTLQTLHLQRIRGRRSTISQTTFPPLFHQKCTHKWMMTFNIFYGIL